MVTYSNKNKDLRKSRFTDRFSDNVDKFEKVSLFRVETMCVQ